MLKLVIDLIQINKPAMQMCLLILVISPLLQDIRRELRKNYLPEFQLAGLVYSCQHDSL